MNEKRSTGVFRFVLKGIIWLALIFGVWSGLAWQSTYPETQIIASIHVCSSAVCIAIAIVGLVLLRND